ncbi:uncharacterized protein LOC132066871 [Lycium ferocissimum]|uniref:uncharacterized protein LOC132066871 n=1 Tax=Lycium ferocissimum TaxID=112874 RepID=UPI0028167FF3|nr:uncharacterized protein LOC132066871 [Lycium ferocissimum]
MDDCGNQMIETTKRPNIHFELIRKTLQFLVPISLISFLLSYTYNFSFFFTYNFNLSTLVFPLFAHVFDRKYIFLLCNSILAFLAKNLSCSSSSPDEQEDVLIMKGEYDEDNKKEVAMKGEVEENEEKEVEEKQETDTTAEEGAEGNEDNMSIEQLNRKIEEFIRKMKEEIRTGAIHPRV